MIDRYTEIELKKGTNYKKWSFRLLIYLLIINLIIFFIIVDFASGFDDADRLSENVILFSIIGTLIFLLGTIFTILSIVKKEKKNYQYYFSIFMYPLYLLLSILLSIINY